jgi:hypothetical protein
MKTLVATALLAYATADETSLLQERLRSSNNKMAVAESSRQDSTSKLLDTAVNMIKNGVTPDVITFVDATNQDINEEVLVAIQSEHDIDQAYINSLCQAFLDAVQALEEQTAAIAVHDSNRLAASERHHTCRSEEAYACAKSRRCEEQLRQKWTAVKHEESVMREIHGYIHDEWCIHPPFFAEIDAWLSHPFNWAQTSPYPILDLPPDVRDFRHVSVGYFHDYREQKIITQRAWLEYNEKLEECAVLEDAWEAKFEPCDEAQTTVREHACQHSVANRQAREAFGQEWNRIVTLFEQARIAKIANEQARKNEWETLKIVQCLLDHVHSSVVTSIETGAPCPTIDSDPDGVTLAIEDCHIVTRGCGEDSMTAHLCLDWCEVPTVPPLPPVEEPACTPAYVAKEQAQFLQAIQVSYTAQLLANDDYPNDLLENYNTLLSPAGWAGCAPPLVCVDCAGSEPQAPCLDHTGGAQTCHVHEEYLSPGQSNADTFRCLDGTCTLQAGRCNGVHNCADASDEMGCDAETTHFVPAYVSSSFACPADFHDDVHFRCGDARCVEKVGLCNGIQNCQDGSDEAHCSGGIQVSVEATSGRTITVETLQRNTGVFHDRTYHFDSLGHFSGKTFIKYSNDDKVIDHLHVMTKLRILEPLTVFIVKLDHHTLPWLDAEGYTPTSYSGVSFSGVRETRHKEWDPSLLATDHFAASAVWSKTFPAGTISIPGNNGGDGSFLIFLDRPSTEDEFDNRLSAYWEHGDCGIHGNDWNWGWCGNTAGECPITVSDELVSEICPSGEAELAAFHGTGQAHSYTLDGCDYFWHAQYRCVPHQVHGEAEYIGCFVDDPARDLGDMVGSRDNAGTNTFELCRAACGDAIYMSLQFGGECFCANDYATAPQYVQVDESHCNANVEPCASTSHNCGGTWHQAIYQINAINEWEMIAHHENQGPDGYFPVSAKNTFTHNANNPSASAFMSVGNLDPEDYLIDGKYVFKLVYTDVADAHTACNGGDALTGTMEAQWTQTSWITEETVTGYEPISPSNLGTAPGGTGCMFTGLARSSQSYTIMDGSHNHDWWFGSVGSTQEWHGGIPALFGGDAQSMTLYVMSRSGGVVTAAPEPECGALPQLVHAQWVAGPTHEYRCDEGHSFDGSLLAQDLVLDVECLPTGLYSSVHACRAIDDCVGHSCGAFGTCVDQHMDYTCNCLTGFEMHTETTTGEKICGNIDDCHGHLCGEAGVCVDLVSDYECECADGWRQVVRHDDDLKLCERVECGEVPEVDNVVSMAATGLYPWSRSKAVFEETVEFLCADGYSTTGELDGPRSFTIMCQADEKYSAPQQCLPISCGAPEPAGGANPVSSAPAAFGQTVDYSCPHGFGPDSFERTCMANGRYSPAIACEPRACGLAPLFPRANNAHDGIFFFGQTVEYRCAEGYSTDAANPAAVDFALECLADGWDTAVVGCVPVTCEVVHDDTHTPASPYTIDYESINIVTCAEGYTLDGTAGGATHLFSQCNANGVADLESCMPVTCPAAVLMTALNSAVQEHRDYTIGNKATYTCSEGHAVASIGASSFEVECLRSGMFSAMSTCRNIDDCEGHSCGSNGHCVDGINDYSCECESGFEEEMVGGEKMCGNIDDCGPNACGGHGACHDLVNGYSCECDTGYRLEGEGDGQNCAAVQCDFAHAPWDLGESILTEDSISFPHTLYIECEAGHRTQYNKDFFMVMCSPDGEIQYLGDENPRCAPKVCGQPPEVVAEHRDQHQYHFGETAVQVCRGGDVQITHECNADGVFSQTSEFSTCQNSCGRPSVPAHAHRSDGAGEVYHPNPATYTCDDGYTPLASGAPGQAFSQMCRANGVFEALTEGVNGCVPVVCQKPAAPQHWQWVTDDPCTTQSPASLRCAEGYSSMEAGADQTLQVTCTADGSISELPQACVLTTYQVTGRITNAISRASQGVASAIMEIAGQTVTTDASGHYSVTLPAGDHSYSLNAHGFITISSASMTVTADQTFTISMSPELSADSWRAVLTWDEHPRDLDSHLQFYGEANACPEMYYGRPSASCAGVLATLDVDDVSSWGPETTTLSGVNSCGCTWWDQTFGGCRGQGVCRWVYKVKNYSGYYNYEQGWVESRARVVLYNGDHMVREFEVNANHGHTTTDGIGHWPYDGSDYMWSVFAIDGSGNVQECSNANCD